MAPIEEDVIVKQMKILDFKRAVQQDDTPVNMLTLKRLKEQFTSATHNSCGFLKIFFLEKE